MSIYLIKIGIYSLPVKGHAFNYFQQFTENLQDYLSQHLMSLSPTEV